MVPKTTDAIGRLVERLRAVILSHFCGELSVMQYLYFYPYFDRIFVLNGVDSQKSAPFLSFGKEWEEHEKRTDF